MWTDRHEANSRFSQLCERTKYNDDRLCMTNWRQFRSNAWWHVTVMHLLEAAKNAHLNPTLDCRLAEPGNAAKCHHQSSFCAELWEGRFDTDQVFEFACPVMASVFRRVCTMAKRACCLHVRPSARPPVSIRVYQRESHWFTWNFIRGLFWNSVKKVQIWLKSGKNIGALYRKT
jgi:hypothetical protein